MRIRVDYVINTLIGTGKIHFENRSALITLECDQHLVKFSFLGTLSNW